MPVDRRLRDGLHTNAGALDPPVERAFDHVLRRGRRRRRVRRASAALAVCLTVGGLAIALPRMGDERAPLVAAAGERLQGTWSTGPLGVDTILDTVRTGGGDPSCAAELIGSASTVEWTFTVEGERWFVTARLDGGAGRRDRGGFIESLSDGTVRLTEPDGPSTTTFSVTAQGDGLEMRLVGLRASGEDGRCEVRAEALAQLGHPFSRVG